MCYINLHLLYFTSHLPPLLAAGRILPYGECDRLPPLLAAGRILPYGECDRLPPLLAAGRILPYGECDRLPPLLAEYYRTASVTVSRR